MNEHRITLNQLIRISEDATWEDFEAMPDGRLVLMDHAQTLIPDEEPVSQFMWVFEMQVGTHFERPMQAIMCAGHFIRMRGTAVYENTILGKLDPNHPEACLYQYPISPYQQTQPVATSFTWRPTPPQYAPPWLQHAPPWQQNVQNVQGLAPPWQQNVNVQGLAGSGSMGRYATTTANTANVPVQQGIWSGLVSALGVKI